MKKNIKWLIMSAALWIFVVLGTLFAKARPDLITEYFTPFSRRVSLVLGKICSFAGGISVGEILIFICILLFLFFLTLVIIRKMKFMRFISLLILCVSVGVFAESYLWGFNNYAEPAEEILGIETKKYTEDELFEAAQYYLNKANELSVQVEREDGQPKLDSLADTGRRICAAYENLGKVYPEFAMKSYPAKGFITSEWFYRFDLAGIYIPFTGECNVVKSEPNIAMPHTIAHEYAHYYGFAREKEANLVGFLALMHTDDKELQYSAYYSAYVYCHNALGKEKAALLRDGCHDVFREDVIYVSEQYAKHEGTASKIGDKINDTYLKAVSQSEGTKSYGQVVDLLIAYYQQNIK